MVGRSDAMMLVVLLMATWVVTPSTAQQQKVTTLPEPTVEVLLRQGVILGAQEEAGNGRIFYSFKTIPFAEPPVGNLRFKDPVPSGPWPGVRNGSIKTPKCPQLTNSTVEGQEDCLYLSVYTPRIFNNAPQVMMPRVDGHFLPDYPAILLRKGWYNKVDIISGVTQDEAAVISLIYTLSESVANDLVQNFTVNGPLSLIFESWEDDPEYLARRAFHHYLGPIELTEEKRDPLIRLFSDRMFDICHLDAVSQHLRTSHQNVYTYKLQHRGGKQSVFGLFPTVPDWYKDYVGHVDDIQYLFSQEKNNSTLDRQEDLFVSRIMVDLWTNFATNGNPTPDLSLGFRWTPTSISKDSYLAITSSPEMKTLDNCKIREFWKNMPTMINKRLYPERFFTCRLPGCIDLPFQ